MASKAFLVTSGVDLSPSAGPRPAPHYDSGASALDGDDVYCGDIRVTMEGDVIKVAEMKNRKSAKTFFEQTNKKLSMQLEELKAAKPLVVKPSAIVS